MINLQIILMFIKKILMFLDMILKSIFNLTSILVSEKLSVYPPILGFTALVLFRLIPWPFSTGSLSCPGKEIRCFAYMRN